jgi:hypothetical protein
MEFYGNYQVYSDSGVDLTLLRENLKRTPTARLQNGVWKLRFLAELQKPGHGGQGRCKPSQMAIKDLCVEGLLRQFVTHDVGFVLVGGLAMCVHGSAYITEDADVCYAQTLSSRTNLVTALTPLHPCLSGPSHASWRLEEAILRAGPKLALTTDVGSLDLFSEIDGVGNYDDVLSASDKHSLFGLSVHVLSLDALLASKQAGRTTKDRLHLLELEELRKLRDTNLQRRLPETLEAKVDES